MRYWLGPWAWNSPRNWWEAPAGAQAAVDLRSPGQCAETVTPGSNSFALFVTPNATNLGSDYTNLGTDPAATWSQQQQNRWKSALNLPRGLAATHLHGIVAETLTVQADPTGQDRALPLVPTMNRQYEIWIGGSLAFQKLFDPYEPEAQLVFDLLKRDYRRIRQDVLDGKSKLNFHRKFLGNLVRKFKIDRQRFVPADLPDESDLPPETTITDNFTRADAGSLGSSSEGWSWTEVFNSFDIASNQARATTNDGSHYATARADSDLSSADHYGQVDVLNLSGSANYGGSCARFAAAANTHYKCLADVGNNIYLVKTVAGTDTNLSNTSSTYTSGNTYKCEINGTTLKAYNAGVEKLSITDSAISSNTRCGLFGYNAGATPVFDNFQAADLAASTTLYTQLESTTRGLLRGMYTRTNG